MVSLGFAIPSFARHETRAGAAGLIGAALGAGLLAAALLPWAGKLYLAGGLLAVGIAGAVWLALPLGAVERPHERPTRRVDERTIPFSRRRLKPGTPQHESYYREHPEHKDADEALRLLPGLLSPRAPMAEPAAFAATEAGFFLPKALRKAVDGPIAAERKEISPGAAAEYVKRLGRYFGARSAGIARVRDYQVYSHIGRGSGEYGAPVALDHPYVIAFSFEMAEEMVRAAPRAAEVIETARQYSEAARVAVQVAAWIRAMGYEARAHIDGNYRLILPLVGRDAGLGEIGRMGLLMTPGLGPRIRLSAVSTTLPLACDPPGDSPAVLDFCRICKKCAENCPSQAIPVDDRQEIEGVLRWKVDAERCFHYWNTVGTDCGRCLAVCPYSHPDDPAHNLVRWLVARSGMARRVALRLDDAVYGRRPKPRPGPEWTQKKS
jgi:reductive dehalogenase